MNDAEIRTESERLAGIHQNALKDLESMWRGRVVEIKSNYNGQPCGGQSKPSLFGRRFVVTRADILGGTAYIHFHISHTRGYGLVPIREVELVASEKVTNGR